MSLSGCGLKNPAAPSILLIAVEGLSFLDLTCEESNLDTEGLGLQTLCQDSVRFTHAYTTSTLAQPALTSLFTGLYPVDHKVHHNGYHSLADSFTTNAEVALKKGYRTLFVSAGPPIFKKSGLHQGFETFRDKIRLRKVSTYRSSSANFNIIQKWITSDIRKKPFFAAVHLNDLLYSEATTRANNNEERSNTRLSQLLETSESLNNFILFLKKRNLYDSTTIVLAGLNGHVNPLTQHVATPISIGAENTQVTLLIKPSQKKRDLPINWKVDTNVTLADVGHTLFDFIKSENPNLSHPLANPVSLMPAINNKTIPWDKNRLILIESAWGSWHKLSNIRYAARKGHYFIKHDKKMQIYNTLIDRYETQPLNKSTPLTIDLLKESKSFFKNIDLKSWSGIDHFEMDKVLLAQTLFSPNGDSAATRNLNQIFKTHLDDNEIPNWLAHSYIERKNWIQLKKVAIQSKNQDWQYLAEQYLKQENMEPKGHCLKNYVKAKPKKALSAKQCRNQTFVSLTHYLAYPKKKRLLRQFIRLYKNEVIDRDLAKQSYYQYKTWDINHLKYIVPSPSYLLLHFPENKKLLESIHHEINKVWN